MKAAYFQKNYVSQHAKINTKQSTPFKVLGFYKKKLSDSRDNREQTDFTQIMVRTLFRNRIS